MRAATFIIIAGLATGCGDGRTVALPDLPSLARDHRSAPDRLARPEARPADAARPDRRAPDLRPPDACAPWSPVKILVAVDVSGSMQFTDAGKRRQSAVQELVQHLATSANVSFAVLAYNAKVKVNGASGLGGFSQDAALLKSAIAGLAQAELLSDLQGGLAHALKLLDDDMAHAKDVARTRYAVLLLSEGVAEPACKAGCANDPPAVPVVTHWCDLPRAEWCSAYNPPSCSEMMGWFPALAAPCLEYNSEPLLLGLVKEIVALKAKRGAGAVALHAARLVDPASSAYRAQHGIDLAKLTALLQQLAAAGGGSYLDLYAPGAKLETLPLDPLCP